ncbi:MAG: DUF4281 domain-containing protein [Alphaproteobacteria bacterium]|jgi:hypothetical protein|nr:DUF4281 domain-containing protein [Alphaproteobacteria bacterium]
MSDAQIYIGINALVLPAWILLVFLPGAGLTRRLVHSGLYPIVFGLIYIVFISRALVFGETVEGTGFGSLEAVMKAFDTPAGLLTGWTHYLVFDLFVGAWIGRDALARNVSHFVRVPGQVGSFILGPVGLLVYLAGRWLTGRGGFFLDAPGHRG